LTTSNYYNYRHNFPAALLRITTIFMTWP